ncbi:CDP-alcohol phosphatidyltransferase family protein [Desulforhopalus singaporensis]|uniref:CDP-diacylglycerol---serine O-phosphatidyltransferase n=1 Tax=Desulforhopalus singaporensis TaxID=91360 RepID=A0A1H0TY84_9BACT|nr:CDP-alcohol phosphatidyltransferase family protein [Desulforhopalus singaporensis]SDP58903.1 CDP-diacylglycerol---serine O-phosphatidyltransferase [Desulforhopalus singaporensis]
MDRVFVISIAALIGTGFYAWVSRVIRNPAAQKYVVNHLWFCHPNAICYWRAAMALIALPLYFYFGMENIAILIFTFAAILDGVDGVVARNCNLVTSWGESLDPLCDKLTYLPPMLGFAYCGILSVKLVWILLIIEFAGQFFARKILSLLNSSGAANNFGKIKAIICFGLVIFSALLDENPYIINIGDQVLIACILLAAASIIFKFVPNRLYADILSTLNFTCGITSLYMTSQHRFAWAISIIIIGQLFDLFDGRMAEKHGGTKYGPYLDDIADFVSFGLAPAYVIIQSGGKFSWLFAAVFIIGVAYRLIRFVTIDKHRTDLPEGVFNGLPSPAGALIVLGAALVFTPNILSAVAISSTVLMVSHIRFAHFGRIILRKIPRPIFFTVCATIVVAIAIVFKTKNVEMYGYLILSSVIFYMAAGRKCIPPDNQNS